MPALAESWTLAGRPDLYVQVCPGVKFHDGTDFDADAVKFNYDRWLDFPESYVASDYTYYIDSVIARPRVVKTAAPDPSTSKSR